MKTVAVRLIWFLAVVAIAGSSLTAQEDEREEEWTPAVPEGMPERWDWIQLTSLEWLKGEIIALQDDDLEFESSELEELTLDWDDIKRVRTAHRMEVRFLGDIDLNGRFFVDDDLVKIMPKDAPTREFRREDLLSVTSGSPRELDHWAMKIALGTNVRRGNSNLIEANLSSKFVRRSAKSRLTFEYLGNYNVTEGVEVSNNHRASAAWNRILSDRFFWTPVFGEYFRDPFQNTAHRTTLGIGVGYQVLDSKNAKWRIGVGPAFQGTRFDDVVPGDPTDVRTPALVVNSSTEVELTSRMDFLTEYRLQFTKNDSGTSNHHMEIAFETEITNLLDFDVRWVWDRLHDPQRNSDGVVPEQDDLSLIVAVGFDF